MGGTSLNLLLDREISRTIRTGLHRDSGSLENLHVQIAALLQVDIHAEITVIEQPVDTISADRE
ncbi:MAG: hypothetical protein AVDCRST_MAG14-2359 [uncultured Rubrobacteraceae bacterium]|uniref:Uncharacterized protein n=1 Tax=uncultured Rubrobacteraceae bacterium TaxID=349277 RepID=A0A6J4R8M2_9ACTN|nr:MAG: hypothetical protein AVDCRST_MAG14-2359 [uncultured Rubrobacteraceae bacterium]